MNQHDELHDSHDAIAAYATLEGAERAVAHLVSCGYDEHEVQIGPRDYEVVDEHPLGRVLRTWLPRGAVVGAIVAAAAAIGAEVGSDALIGTVLPLALWGLAIGAVIGLFAAAVAYRVELARTFLSAPDVLEPTRFEVIAEHHAEQAGHDLARWWDPEAPSAGLPRAA
jgi:hypothetical protein